MNCKSIKESFIDLDSNDCTDEKLKQFFQQNQKKEDEKHKKKKESQIVNVPLKKTFKEYGSDINAQLKSLSIVLYEGNYDKSLAIINFLMKRNEVDSDDKRQLLLQFLDMLCSKNAFQEAQENLISNKHIFEDKGEDEVESNLKIFGIVYELYKIKIDLHQSDLYLSYFFYLRKTQKWKKQIANFKKNDENQKKKNDYADTLADEIYRVQGQVSYEFILNLQLTENSTGSLNLLYGWGDNSQFSTMGIGTFKSDGPHFIKQPIAQPVMRNRVIISISCGDYHTIALVSGTKNYDYYRAQNKEEKDQYSVKDVFVWGRNSSGQCDGDPDLVKYYNSPVVIPELIDKDIENVCAYKNYTVCYDKKGNVYEWGANIMDVTKIEPKFKIENGIKSLGIGNGFKCALDKKGDVFAWGNLKDYEGDKIISSEKPKKINESDEKMIKLSVGYDHILCTNKKNFQYFWGCNDSGQGAFSERETSVSKLSVSKYLGGEKISNCWACEKLSIVQTVDNELYYFGLYAYDPKKIAWYPRDFCQEDEALPLQITHCGSNLYMCSTDGKIYNWDLKQQSRFKQEKYKGENKYAEVKAGKGWLMLRKPYIMPSESKIEVKQLNSDADYDVTLKLSYKEVGLKDFLKFNIEYNLRVGICISEEKLEKSAVEILNHNRYNDDDIKEIDQTSIKGISVQKLRNTELSVKDISIDENSTIKFSIPRNGKFYLYVTINEELIEQCISKPKIITVTKSKNTIDKSVIINHKQEFEVRKNKQPIEESFIVQELNLIDEKPVKQLNTIVEKPIRELKTIVEKPVLERQSFIKSSKKLPDNNFMQTMQGGIFKDMNTRRSSLFNKEKSMSRCGSAIKDNSLSRSLIKSRPMSREGSIIKDSNSKGYGSIIKTIDTNPSEIVTPEPKNILSSSKQSGRQSFLQGSSDMKTGGLSSRMRLKKSSNIDNSNQGVFPNQSKINDSQKNSLPVTTKNQDVPVMFSKFTGGSQMKKTEQTWYDKTEGQFSNYDGLKSSIMQFCSQTGSDLQTELNQTMQTMNLTVQKNKFKKLDTFENMMTPNRRTQEKATFSALKPNKYSFDQGNKPADDTSDIEEQDLGGSMISKSSLHRRGTSFKITSSARQKSLIGGNPKDARSVSNMGNDSVKLSNYNKTSIDVKKPATDLINKKFDKMHNTVSRSPKPNLNRLKDVYGNICHGSVNRNNTNIFKNPGSRNASINKDNKLDIDKDEIDIKQKPLQPGRRQHNNKTMGPNMMQEIKAKRNIASEFANKLK